MSEKIVCSHCGEKFDEEDMTCFDGDMLCDDCLDELTVVCERCGERILAEDAADSDLTLCRHCYNEYYEPVHIESKSTQQRVDMRNNTHSFSVNSFYLIVF